MSKHAAKQATNYRQILLDKKKSLLVALGAKAGSLAKADRVGEEDLAQQSHEEFVSLRLNGLDYLVLRQVEEALDRLEAGDYGVCLACEELIPAKRLQALPWARYCVQCQEQVVDVASWETGPELFSAEGLITP